MLKLTNPEATLTYTAGVPEHQPVYVDARKVFAVVVGNFGCTTILSTDTAYICVKESAEDVARMVDEAKGNRNAQ